MSPSANLEPAGDFQAGIDMPDFASFPERYGWATSNARGYRFAEQLCGTERPLRVVAVGGGITGIQLAKFLPEQLNNVSLTIYEKNPELGGTWYENRYPGIRCDIPSHNYQFTWAKNPDWKEFYSSGAEIQKYILDVVAAHDLRKFFHLNHMVIGAKWDEDHGVWDIKVKNLLTNRVHTDTAEIFLNNEGILNHWKWPDIEGLHDFQGQLCHTAEFDPNTDFEGKRIVVIGAGSTELQIVPAIVDKISKLYSWIRSPNWVTQGFAQKYSGPNGTNFIYDEAQKAHWRENPREYQEYLKGIESELNVRFRGILKNTPDAVAANNFSVDSMKSRLGGRTDIEDAIIPKTFSIGCRRTTPGVGFLEALTAPHVTVFKDKMRKVTPKGFLDHEGNEHEVDMIICATGFDTSWIPRYPIEARGKNLQDERRKETISYLSIAAPDFPNFFHICGPYGPFAHGSFMSVSELLLNNVLKLIKKFQRKLIKSVTPKREVCDAFAEHADLFVNRTAWDGPCSAWFKKGGGQNRLSVFPGSRLVFFDVLKEPRFEDYKIDYWVGEWQWLGNGFHLIEYTGGDDSHYLGAVDDPIQLLPKVQAAQNGDAVKNGEAVIKNGDILKNRHAEEENAANTAAAV